MVFRCNSIIVLYRQFWYLQCLKAHEHNFNIFFEASPIGLSYKFEAIVKEWPNPLSYVKELLQYRIICCKFVVAKWRA